MIDFLKYTKLYFTLSLIVIAVGLFSIFRFGYNVSIDFAGGTTLEYKFNSSQTEPLLQKHLLAQGVKTVSINRSSENAYIIRTASINEVQEKELREQLQKTTKSKITMLRFETVGPMLGRETMNKTIIAAIVAIIGILIYITFAFKNVKYGLAAIVAMFHDLLVIIGSYSLLSLFFGAEIDSLFVTALLTTMSFSVHDTIVVFDKIREYRKHDRSTSMTILANKAFTETIVRSFNNSLTIILMLTSLALMGGDSIRYFVITLLIGTITGTYSSPFIAVPLLVLLEKRGKS